MKPTLQKKILAGILLLVTAAAAYWGWVNLYGGGDPVGYLSYSVSKRFKKSSIAGSLSCKKCHERFYSKWSTSWHGLAMQSFTAQFAQTKLRPQTGDIAIGHNRYRFGHAGGKGWVCETDSSNVPRNFPIAQVLGGKNVYYFLTTLDRGFLQVLPIGFDSRRKEWFDIPNSALRNHAGFITTALCWRDREYTFNTSCYRCHVSQLSTNYSPDSDSYHTRWAEPGINCETCHGDGTDHNKACILAGKRRPPKDMKIISTKNFSALQINSLCATCHAKMNPLTSSFVPGERFFDHYDLTTLEDPDFYPDGRELGEDFTFTTWLTAPCLKDTTLDCMHCHTSSGRYRFHGDSVNFSCMPCHESRVRSLYKHAHHADTNKAITCVACHMPMTEFARMRRSDHSLRPPTPATAIAFGSPNACLLCHKTASARWADSCVRKWHAKDYQAPYLYRGELVAAARAQNWKRLPEMLSYVLDTAHDAIFANSLVRLMADCPDEKKWPVLIQALGDRSPLVRASAANALSGHFTRQSVRALCGALGDGYRIVRIRAAGALAGVPEELMPDEGSKIALSNAEKEVIESLKSRPDNEASVNNLGNHFLSNGKADSAIKYFKRAKVLNPMDFAPWANAALAYNTAGNSTAAERNLRKAISLAPSNAGPHLNLGLLLGEQKRFNEAAVEFHAAIEADSTLGVAAYNLAVIEDMRGNSEEALTLSRKASSLLPDDPKYGYTYAYYLWRTRRTSEAIAELEKLMQTFPGYTPGVELLATLYGETGNSARAKALHNRHQ